MPVLKIIIASRRKAQKLSEEIPGAWIISIRDRGSEHVYFKGDFRDILFCCFDDVEDSTLVTAPTIGHVQSIIKFAQQFKPDDTVIVHCEAGICRSSAVALGVYVLHHGFENVDDAFRAYRGLILPNPLLAKLFDDALNLKGEFIALCDRVCKTWDATKGIY